MLTVMPSAAIIAPDPASRTWQPCRRLAGGTDVPPPPFPDDEDDDDPDAPAPLGDPPMPIPVPPDPGPPPLHAGRPCLPLPAYP